MVDEKFFDIDESVPREIIKPSVSGFWSEKVYVVTEDYEIKGFVFMPKTGRKNRILSDILNSERRFVAIKDAEIFNRKAQGKSVDSCEYIQINLDSIIMIRPCIKD